MSSIKFSIIIPVYNVEKYLNECVDSVLNQTYKYMEIILVDDGSTDSSPQICDSYAEKDNRIRAIHKENGGLSSARNAGIKNMTGDYVLFLDSDDFWDNNKALEHLSYIISEQKPDVVCYGYKEFCTGYFKDERRSKTGSYYHRQMGNRSWRGRESNIGSA